MPIHHRAAPPEPHQAPKRPSPGDEQPIDEPLVSKESEDAQSPTLPKPRAGDAAA